MRWGRLAAAVALGALVLASVTLVRGQTIDVVDREGRPQLAYAIYRHQGQRLNFVHPVSYDARPPTLVRSDEAGRLRFPLAVHLHQPFPLQTPPKRRVEFVYAPALHNAGGRLGRGLTASMTGVWEMDAEGRRAVVSDVSDAPERWSETLSTLSFFLGPFVYSTRRPLAPDQAALVAELAGHFRAEYEGFLAQWEHARRPRPPAPAFFLNDGERQRWEAMVGRDLAERPTWGQEMRRLYEDDVASLVKAAERLAR